MAIIDLRIKSKTQGLDIELALRLSIQLLNAVSHIHGAGYAHGDSKPDNCCLDTNHNLKLIDFGCTISVKDLEDDRPFKPSSNTLAYTAPEVLTGRCTDPRSADVWAAGITLFAMLTGNLPWGMASSRDHVYFRYWRGDHHLPGWDVIPNELRAILASMLDTSPDTRFSAEKAHASIGRFLSTRALAG